MYLSQGDIIAITIALGTSLTLMIIMLYANVQLLRENRFLKTRLRIWRKRFQTKGEQL
jgi:ABC-type Na+ efflux pump permease subunit